ncbi:MAG: hypothetical protein LBD14_06810 [Puniceicoccales bacterium]|jgi:outer membrane biosynthesis protein TonB|nr:hypothetical protein [Puniceicoccales bacterium]
MNRTHKVKGWIGSISLHGMLLGALVFLTGPRLTPPPEEKHQAGSLVLNLTGDGTPSIGTPGNTTSPPVNIPKPEQPLFDVEKINKSIERQREEARRRAEEEAKAKTVPPPPPIIPPPPDVKPAKEPEPKQITLKDFQAKHPTPPLNTKPPNGNTRPNKSNNSGAKPIPGININNILGPASPGAGNPNGGGPVVVTQYKDRLRLLLQEQWRELVSREGSQLERSTQGEFRLNISNNGNISFGGWTRNPNNALFERLLRRAIDKVGNAGARPPGMATSFIFAISADIE